MGELARIALVVAEVRTVAVEHEKKFLRRASFERLAHLVEQLRVVARRADVDHVLGVVGQVVDHRALRRLVGDEPRVESRLVEERRKALTAVQLLVFAGGYGREDQRHALVGGVALGQHVAENHQIADFGEQGIGLPPVAVELPVHRARRLPYDIYVDLASRSFGRAFGLVGEALGGFVEVVRLAELRAAQPEVVHDVERENLVAQHVPLLADAVGGPQGQQAHGEERRTGQADVHARRARDVAFVSDLAGREPQQRQVDDADQNHRRIDVAQQFARLARIGRQQVGEHVRGDDRIAEQVQQHDLEGAEEDERKGQPDHHARAPQRHAPHHVESQRHEDQRLDGPHRVRLRIGQHAVGDDQRHEEIDGQQRREAAAGLDRPPAVRLIRVIQIGIHTNSLKKPR